MILTKCGILLTIPRTDGVSSSSLVLFILFRPKPIYVWRCFSGRLIGEPICFTTIDLTISYASSFSFSTFATGAALGNKSDTFLPRL